ncbi:MAG: lipoyl(octanoyl) transferase LipB [Alphaproteobacteria bacterium]|nr:lipoyl(octanoyl) transferase LipB [Alphaproteobacteria bacterium]
MDWKISEELVEYEDALAAMDARVAAIHAGAQDDLVWLLEHPPLYTAGTSAKAPDLLDARFPVFEAGRGGEYTYHGPGQRIAYVMMDLKRRQKRPDVKAYVCGLENWIIEALKSFGIQGERREGRIGIWVETDGTEKKIAAIGVRVRHWITLHGVSINVSPDLSHFEGIIPCGIKEFGVTSLKELLGRDVPMAELDAALKDAFGKIFY